MEKYIALKASAGSGKTFALTVRYISLMLLGAKPNEILTLTFTNKAASQMNERIQNTLLTLGDDEAYINSISTQSNMSINQIIGAKKNLIKEYNNSNLSIYTIDKFISKILREFCGYIGVLDDFNTISTNDIDDLSFKFLQNLNKEKFDKFIDFCLYEKKRYNSLIDIFNILLNKNEEINPSKIEYELIKIQEEKILKIAYEIKSFVLSHPSSNLSAKKSVDFDDIISLLDKSKTWLFKKESTLEFSYFKKISNDDFEKIFQNLKKEINIYYKLKSTYSLKNLFDLFIIFKDFRDTYNKDKNILTFDDISILVYKLVSKHIDKDFLYFRLDSRYSHILIDEFQDTSTLQYKILSPLINEVLSGNDQDKFKTFFYVGDTKQSIYRFRGGKKELFDHLLNQYKQIKSKTLDTNYRSSKNIVQFINNLFLPLNNYEYIKQNSIKENGYIKVIEDINLKNDKNRFQTIKNELSNLIKQKININKIAILTYTNDDVVNLYSYLSNSFPKLKISTETSSKLINQPNVKALINSIKYIYFKQNIYKENLNALLGNKILSNIELDINIKTNSVIQIAKKIATNLKIIDENIIRFIEICEKFNNIIEFIYEVHNIEEAIQNKENQGIQILTIFKSKGLEFDTVFLLDRIKNKNINKDPIVFEYENIDLKNIYYKIQNLQEINKEYKKAIQKEQNLQRQDDLNILYVALSRAKTNIIIFKKEEKSTFDLINLKPTTIGKIRIEEEIIQENIEKKKIPYQKIDLGKQNIKKQIKNSQEYTLESKYFGLATHYVLEMIEKFEIPYLENAIKLSKTKYMQYLNEKHFIDIKDRVKDLLTNNTFQSLLKNSTYTKEQSLKYNDELKYIDLLIKKKNQYIIIDYKTTQESQTEHIYQVSNYKKAISKISKNSNVEAYLFYLKKDQLTINKI